MNITIVNAILVKDAVSCKASPSKPTVINDTMGYGKIRPNKVTTTFPESTAFNNLICL